MLASAIVMPLAALALQPADPTRTAREAYTRCLRTFVERALQERMTPAAFATAYPQQCGPQQASYREAVIRREVAARISRADAEESATLEIDDARLNFSERFDMAQPEPAPDAPQAPATAAAAAQTPATQTPAATPVSAPNPQ